MRYMTAFLGTAAGLAGLAGADVIDVPGEAPTIQVAINLAVDGDEIVVAPGTYFESLNLLGKAITVRSSDGPDLTTIDAFGQLDSAIHAVSGESLDTLIQGFTITGGDADGIDDGDPVADDRGGGLYVDSSSLTVIDCVFIDNSASLAGGGFYANDGTVSFSNCRFELNQSMGAGSAGGGGTYMFNSATTFADCVFIDNVAPNGLGGGMRTGGSNPTSETLVRCTFVGNMAADDGGGLYQGTNSTMTLSACMFVANTAGDVGGGLLVSSSIDLRDSVLNGNTAGNTGSAILALAGSSLTLVNSTVVHNAGGDVLFGGGSKTVRSSVVWDNNGGTIGAGSNVVSYSLVEGGFAGTGNIDADPLFVDPVGPDATAGTDDDDLRLSAGSPAIDAADASAVIGQYPLDLDGNPRALDDPDTIDSGLAVLGLSVDMGAYEFQADPAPPTCPGDLNGDDTVGINDLLQLLGGWGPCP